MTSDYWVIYQPTFILPHTYRCLIVTIVHRATFLALFFTGFITSPIHAGIVIEVDKGPSLTATWRISGSLDVSGVTDNGIADYGTAYTAFIYGSATGALGYNRTGAMYKYDLTSSTTSWVTAPSSSGSEKKITSTSFTNASNPGFFLHIPITGTKKLYLSSNGASSWTADEFSTILSAAEYGQIPDGDFNFEYTISGTTQTLTVQSLSNASVPEPSTAIVMGLLGIVGFAGNRRRRRRESVA